MIGGRAFLPLHSVTQIYQLPVRGSNLKAKGPPSSNHNNIVKDERILWNYIGMRQKLGIEHKECHDKRL